MTRKICLYMKKIKLIVLENTHLIILSSGIGGTNPSLLEAMGLGCE